jgi:hypothetical protein
MFCFRREASMTAKRSSISTKPGPAKQRGKALSWARSEAVADVLQSLAIESLDPGTGVRKLASGYVREDLSLAELCSAIAALDERERGEA